MAKILWQSTRIHVYGGDKNEKKAFSLTSFSKFDNDSTVTLIRGEEKDIPKLLRKFALFTDEDVKKILSMKFKETWWCDECGLIVRIA